MRSSAGAGAGAPLDRILRVLIEAARDKYPTIEQLVNHLRCAHPHYASYGLHSFIRRVRRISKGLSRRKATMDNSKDDCDAPIVNKRRKIDAKNGNFIDLSSTSLSSSSSSEGDDSSSDEDCGEKIENDKDVREKVELMNVEGELGDAVDKKDKGGGDGDEINGTMFKDFGGINGVIDQLNMEVISPLLHPHERRRVGVKSVGGVLLHGPPGCGKTTLARAIANESGVPFYQVSATALVSRVSGASEESIQELFSKAQSSGPSIVFIDEIDAIVSKKENSKRGMECRIVTQLMKCMDESQKLLKSVLVIGATNKPDALDPALRRPGRFELEIFLGVPNECARLEILSTLTCNLQVEGALDLVKLARSTPGFVGADLQALVNKAGNLAWKRVMNNRKVEHSRKEMNGNHVVDWRKRPWSDEEMEKLIITMADFEEAAKMVQPSSKREGFCDIPNVKWDDVGGLHSLRKDFERYIIRRIKFPEIYEDLGSDLPTGFLLYGPPGCGKTLIAKAVANEAGASFMHIKGPELLNKDVGESELAVRTIFSSARTCSPCIIFFDEVDAFTTKNDKEGGGSVAQQLLKQLLIELDGGEERKGVYVIGATNSPEVMNPALLQPGRLGKLLYVPLPSADERGMIFKAFARKTPIDVNVDLMALGKDNACENFSGADISALMHEAVMESIEDRLVSPPPWTIKDVHFRRALEKISPSVSNEQLEHYKLLSKSLKVA